MMTVRYSGVQTTLTCQFIEPSTTTIKSCASMSSQIIKVTLNNGLSDAFQLNVVSAITNPPSTSKTATMIFQTFEATSNAQQDIQSSNIPIQATPGKFSSISYASQITQVVGESDRIKITFKTLNPILQNGAIQLVFPYWFNITSDNVFLSMIDSSVLSCLNNNNLATACSFSSSQQTVTFTGLFASGQLAAGSTYSVTVNGVKNPLNTLSRPQITVQTTDSVFGVIDTDVITLVANSASVIVSSSIQAEQKIVQEKSNYTIQFTVQVPMYAGCLLVIQLPWPDYDLNVDTIDAIQGYGSFKAARYLNFNINSRLNQITITDACKFYVLPNIPSNIIIEGIKNPYTTKTTDGFQIQMLDSVNSQIALVSQANGPKFTAWNGSLPLVTLTADTYLVNSKTTANLVFQTGHYSNALVDLLIKLEDSRFSFQDVQLISSNIENYQFGQLFSNGSTIVIKEFQPNFIPNTQYNIRFKNLKLADSVQTMGPLTIQVFQKSSGFTQYYLIDNSSYSGLLKTQAGQFFKANILPENTRASETAIYQFKLMTQSDIPVGAYLEIILPKEIHGSSTSKCLYQNLEFACKYFSGNKTFRLEGIFQSKFFPNSTDLEFKITDIISPRSLKTSSIFNFTTYISSGGMIDTYFDVSSTVSMTLPSLIVSASITSLSSYRVGDKGTSITFGIQTVSELITGDIIRVELPSQVQIDLTLLRCSSTKQKSALSCNIDNQGAIAVHMSFLGDLLPAKQIFDLKITGFTNPGNGRLTDTFGIKIYDTDYFSIAVLESPALYIQMTLPYILTSSYSINNDNKIPGITTSLELNFTNQHVIPVGSYFILHYPTQVLLNTQQIIVSSPNSPFSSELTVNTTAKTITIKGLIGTAVLQNTLFRLNIQGFKNSNSSAATNSFMLEYFTPEGYPIEIIQSGLTLKTKCNWPCRDCNIINGGPTTCTACNPKDITSLYMLQDSTCISNCSTSYYFSGSDSQGLCLKCNSTCLTCNQSASECTSCNTKSNYPFLSSKECVTACPTGQITDKSQGRCIPCTPPCKNCSVSPTTCTTCENNFYQLSSQCLSSCPTNGLYIQQRSNWTCQTCDPNCATCLGNRTTCNSCRSPLKLNMIDRTCIDACPFGSTLELTKGICSACDQTCRTCSVKTNQCTSCNQNQVVYNGQCVNVCPKGSTLNGDQCLVCSPECTECRDGDPNLCTSCKSGYLSFLFSKCLSQCPNGYVSRNGYCIDPSFRCEYGYDVSENGTVCILTAYACNPGSKFNSYLKTCIPVAGAFAPFPFLLLLMLVTSAFLIALRYKDKVLETNVIQSIICIWCFIEPVLFLIQFALACAFQHVGVLVLTLFAILFHYPLNFYIIKIVIKRRHSKDSVIGHWKSEYPDHYRLIMQFSLYHNHKLLRALTCSAFDKSYFKASFDDMNMNHLKPLLRSTIINSLTSYLLIIVADITCFATMEWPYQLLITCIESFIFVIVMIILQIIDYFQMRNIYLKQGKYYKVNAKSIDMGNVSSNLDERLDGAGNASIRLKKATERRALLEKINEDLDKKAQFDKNYDEFDYYIISGPNIPIDVIDEETLRPLEQEQKIISRNIPMIDQDVSGHRSTEHHLAENRQNMIHQESFEEEIYDKCISERNEDQYGDYDRLDQARQLFYDLNRELVFQRIEREKLRQIMEYNANMSILEKKQFLLNKPLFELQDVQGQFQRDEDNNYVIIKDLEGNLMDMQSRLVNRKGYLIDIHGNIITRHFELVLEKIYLNSHDEIPIKIFKQLFMPKGACDSDDSPVSKAIGTSGHLSMHDEYVGSSSLGRSNKKSRKSLKSIGMDPKSSQRTLTGEEGDEFQLNVKKKSKSTKRATSTKRQISSKKNSTGARYMSQKGSNLDLRSSGSVSTKKASMGIRQSSSVQRNTQRNVASRVAETRKSNRTSISTSNSPPTRLRNVKEKESGTITLKKFTVESARKVRKPRQRSIEDSISDTVSGTSKAVRPRIPVYNQRLKTRESSVKTVKQNRISQNSIYFERDIFNIIELPAERERVATQEDHKRKSTQRQRPIQTQQGKRPGNKDQGLYPFNLIDLKDDRRNRPQNFEFDPIEKQLNLLLDNEKVQLEEIKSKQTQNTIQKFANISSYVIQNQQQASQIHQNSINSSYDRKDYDRGFGKNAFNTSGRLIMNNVSGTLDNRAGNGSDLNQNLREMKQQFYPNIAAPSTVSVQSIHIMNRPRNRYDEFVDEKIVASHKPPAPKHKKVILKYAPPQNKQENIKNIRDIYSQNVRQMTNVGVQPKSMLRGINKYDSFVNDSVLSRGRVPHDDITTYDDPYKQLTKIFSNQN
ncbi:UNKNOWN [Stylonychia lemnae]|uniref:Uncharacterized protein n=1 Tax=Stylonychia lemnae TaxID=5949 RepID=A0A077ZTZ9_STYLE|nr:UNKNOWN [Stylonychia lemnae]|eukprot:CDW73373.1 UNKNOWN [Stylonychia lemnae]